ncbi:hypothetical protein ACWDTP_04645 [Mycobacterium sp. NPDC003449]
MTPIDFAIIIGGPLAMLTLSYGIPALADRLTAGPGVSEEYVAPYQRRYLLDVAPAEEPRRGVLHGISNWQSLLSTLHIKAPNALCGESLVGDEQPGAPGRNLPRCPQCVVRAPWAPASAVLEPAQ